MPVSMTHHSPQQSFRKIPWAEYRAEREANARGSGGESFSYRCWTDARKEFEDGLLESRRLRAEQDFQQRQEERYVPRALLAARLDRRLSSRSALSRTARVASAAASAAASLAAASAAIALRSPLAWLYPSPTPPAEPRAHAPAPRAQLVLLGPRITSLLCSRALPFASLMCVYD